MHHLLGNWTPVRLVLGRFDHFCADLNRRFAQALDHVSIVPWRNAEPCIEEALQCLTRRPGLPTVDGQARWIVRIAWVSLGGHDVIDRRKGHIAKPGVVQRDVLGVAVRIAHHIVSQHMPAKLLQLDAHVRGGR